jgi:hypothetical protein
MPSPSKSTAATTEKLLAVTVVASLSVAERFVGRLERAASISPTSPEGAATILDFPVYEAPSSAGSRRNVTQPEHDSRAQDQQRDSQHITSLDGGWRPAKSQAGMAVRPCAVKDALSRSAYRESACIWDLHP